MNKAIVFGGPSLQLIPATQLSQIEVLPPIKRGDLDCFMSVAPGTILISDGLFGGTLSISPMECRTLIEKGWRLFGTASIGAIRAAELWSVGMVGIGTIYHLFRSEQIEDDTEVCVAYNPETYQELTLSTVQIRSAISHCTSLQTLDANRVLEISKKIYWRERSPSRLAQTLLDEGLEQHLADEIIDLASEPSLHPKKLDTKQAVDLLLTTIWPPL